MKHSLLFILIFTAKLISSQVLNAYAKITSVTGGSVLALSNVDQTGHTFTVGGQVLVMQMQDNVIGTNTTNASTFGNLSSIANAGRYEVRTITARTPASGAPTSVTIFPVLANTFNTGANSSAQLISFRDLGANYTTSANITCLDWNGNVGGVIAISVTNTLTLQHRILADNNGFRQGRRSNDDSGPTCVAANQTVYIANDRDYGEKGEGIYLSTNNNFDDARGKILNGGGGGVYHNSGGGGGGNYSSGGNGGQGYNGCSSFNSCGLGGIGLSAHISASRVFMGGGGGGGQQNNGNGTAGGDGGGIILIKAGNITSNSTCTSSLQISANGQTASNGDNDGCGGGGAGGSIILQVNSYSITATCPLLVRANAGNGGNSLSGDPHAGGGGGGQGVIIYSTPQPTVNVTTQVNNGTAGIDESGGTASGGSGGGSSGSGTIASSSGPLPIELVSFGGTATQNGVNLNWQTASELNNNVFLIEKSANAIDFSVLATLKGAGNSNTIKDYEIFDHAPFFGVNYYRLTQIDFDGTTSVAPIITVNTGELDNFKVYPNPLNENESLIIELGNNGYQTVEVTIQDFSGKTLLKENFDNQLGQPIILNNINLDKGIYQLNVKLGEFGSKNQKIIIR